MARAAHQFAAEAEPGDRSRDVLGVVWAWKGVASVEDLRKEQVDTVTAMKIVGHKVRANAPPL
jgi:hypothetical protein